jgi:hypothetical protein
LSRAPARAAPRIVHDGDVDMTHVRVAVVLASMSLACTGRLVGGEGDADAGSDETAAPTVPGTTAGANTSTSGGGPPNGSTTSASGEPPSPDTGVPPSPDTGEPPGDEGSSTTADVDPVDALVGVALLEDGLCPWAFDVPWPMTLRYTTADLVCNANLGTALYEAGQTPALWVELQLPVSEPGVYDLAMVGGFRWINLVEVDGGGGGGGSEIDGGILEITSIDATTVSGTLTGFIVQDINGMTFDVNGSFVAVRCTPEEWLDVPSFDPNDGPDGGYDPACSLPGE